MKEARQARRVRRLSLSARARGTVGKTVRLAAPTRQIGCD